jgi:hypothetical protein
MTTMAISAAGISQATCPPYWAENRRVIPPEPPNAPPPPNPAAGRARP